MEVPTVDYTMKLPKDAKEVVDLVDAILEKAMAKKPASEYTELLDELMVAADGFQNVGPGLKGQLRDELAGYLVKTLMARLAPVKKTK